jgi:hypothetical protein
VVSEGFAESGGSPSCRASPRSVAAARRARPRWSLPDDVVEEAVEDALAGGVKVDICVGNADLDVLGRIGAAALLTDHRPVPAAPAGTRSRARPSAQRVA